jgi:hypothetical protein
MCYHRAVVAEGSTKAVAEEEHTAVCPEVWKQCAACAPEVNCLVRRKHLEEHLKAFHPKTPHECFATVGEMTYCGIASSATYWHEKSGFSDTQMYLFAAFASKCGINNARFPVDVLKDDWKTKTYHEDDDGEDCKRVMVEMARFDDYKISLCEVKLTPLVFRDRVPSLGLRLTSKINPDFWLEGRLLQPLTDSTFELYDVQTQFGSETATARWFADSAGPTECAKLKLEMTSGAELPFAHIKFAA